MRIWCKCINRNQSDKRPHNSTFMNLNNSDYSYTHEYLGAKGIVNIHPQDLALHMSYSVRDGICVKLKRNRPYRVLFDYVDGTYYINDDSDRGYFHLVEQLSALKEQTKTCHYETVYQNLEEIMFGFVVDFCNM